MKIALTRKVKAPTRADSGSAGLDIYVPDFIGDQQFVRDFSAMNQRPGSDAFIDSGKGQLNVFPFGKVYIPTGLRIEVPKDTMLMVANKGGVSWTDRVTNLAMVIDFSFTGEVFISVVNHSSQNTVLLSGQKLIQLVCVPILYPSVEIIPESEIHLIPTDRGSGSMGSSGK